MRAPVRRRSGHVLAVAAVCAVMVLGGCVSPVRDSGALTADADAALGSAISETRTAVLALRARADGKVTNAYADTVVTDSESALGPIEASFGNVDPPSPANDQLRTDVMALLGDAGDALATARLAVRRDDTQEMRVSATDLAELADTMETARDGLG